VEEGAKRVGEVGKRESWKATGRSMTPAEVRKKRKLKLLASSVCFVRVDSVEATRSTSGRVVRVGASLSLSKRRRRREERGDKTKKVCDDGGEGE
jgi:hypothetical protein